jgi:hypothetical protein
MLVTASDEREPTHERVREVAVFRYQPEQARRVIERDVISLRAGAGGDGRTNVHRPRRLSTGKAK